MKKAECVRQVWAVLLVCAVAATAVGQTQTWLGTMDGNWSNGANWSGGVVPTPNETEVFNASGNGNTTVSTGSIQLSPGPSSTSIVFDTPAASAYTIGGPNAGDGSITFASSAAVGNFITVSPSVPTSQLINAQLVGQGSGIDVANDRRAAGQSLTLAGPISAGATWFVTGPGHTVISGSVSTPASAISGGITHDGLGPLTLGGAPKTVSAFTSGGNLEIDAPLTASRSVRLAGDVYLNDQLTLAGATLAASGVVHGGPSGILTTAFSAGGYIAAYPAQTLTLDCPISGGSFYFGLTAAAPVPPGGTVVLTRANAYTGSTTIGAGVVSVSSIGDSGVAGNLGSGSTIQFGSAIASGEAVLRYTGSGESSNRAIVVGSSVGGPPVIEQAGTGLLKLTGSVSVTGTLTLRGDVGSPGELAGSVSAAIIKLGAGTWTLSGANSGVSATVEAGTLAVNYDTSNTRKLSGALALGNGTLAFTGASGTQIEYATSTTLDGTAAITRSGGNSVTIELGPISRQSGSSLEVSGDGIVTTNNLNSSGILPGIFVNGQFAMNATNAFNGPIVAVPDSAYTNVNRLGGTIADSPSGALVRIADGGGSGDINMAASGTTSITALMQNATGGEATVNIGTGNMLRLGAVGTALLPSGKSALTFNDGTLTAGGNADNVSGELLVNNESTANPVIINSVIADNGTGIVTLGKAGAGTLVLNGANTYSGPTAVTGGVVSIPALADAGSASGIGTGTTIILDGGTLRYTGGAVSTNRAIQLGSSIDGKSGTLDASGTGAVNFTTSFITYGTTKQRRTLCLAGTNTGANTMAATIRDNGVTNASAPVSLVKSGPGQWVLTGTNSYSGGTVVEEGVLQIAGFGTPGANSASSAIMVAAGASLEFNRFSGLVLANPISGEGSVVVSGTAPLSFNCGNSFSGGLVINSSGGVALFFNSMSAPPPSAPSLGSGPITMANNTSVDIGGFTTVTGLLDTSGTGSNAVITTTNSLPPPPTLTISGPGIHTFAGRITGNMSLIKDGAGIQFLNGANTYTGPTYIDGGILGGTGSISGAVYLNVGGAIAPGHSIGTFTLGSLDISSGVSAVASGALEFELDTPVASDKITLTAGPLAIGAGVLEIDDFQFTTSANFGPGTYTLIHGASPIVGSLGPDVTETIDGLDATLAIGNGGTDLVLNVVPEPASLVLAVTALGAVMICRAGAKLLS